MPPEPLLEHYLRRPGVRRLLPTELSTLRASPEIDQPVVARAILAVDATISYGENRLIIRRQERTCPGN